MQYIAFPFAQFVKVWARLATCAEDAVCRRIAVALQVLARM